MLQTPSTFSIMYLTNTQNYKFTPDPFIIALSRQRVGQGSGAFTLETNMSKRKLPHEYNHEVWVWINGYEDHYKVSSFGRVMSLKYGKERILSPRSVNNTALVVSLSLNSYSNEEFIHHLVWNAYVGPLKKGANLQHIDGKKENNRLDNLRLFKGNGKK